MSNGDKPPGVRDIRSLRERLGMLNKGTASGPSGPKPESSPQEQAPTDNEDETGAAPFDSVDASTETVDIAGNALSAPPQAAEPPSETPLPGAPAPSPAAPSGRTTFDVFSKGNAGTAERAGASIPEDAPTIKKVDSRSSAGNSAFANPLQLGQYSVPSASYALSAEDQAELDGFEKKAQGISLVVFIVSALLVAGIAGGLGFLGNKVLQERKLVNMSIEASKQAEENVGKAIADIEPLLDVIEQMNPSVIQIDLLKDTSKVPDELPIIDAAGLLHTRFPLPPTLSPLVARFVADSNSLLDQLREHRLRSLGFRNEDMLNRTEENTLAEVAFSMMRRDLQVVADEMGALQGKRNLAIMEVPKSESRSGKTELELISPARRKCQMPLDTFTGPDAPTCAQWRVQQRALAKEKANAKVASKAKGKSKDKQADEEPVEMIEVRDVLDVRGRVRTVREGRIRTMIREHNLFYEGQTNVKSLYRMRVGRLQATSSRIRDYLKNLKDELEKAADRETHSTL